MTILRRVRGAFDTPAGLAVGRMISQSLSLVSAPVIAQSLGPAGRGYTASSLAFVVVVGVVVGMGVPLAIRRRVVDTSRPRDVIATGRLFAWLTIVPTTAVGAVALLTVLSSLPRGDWLAFMVAMAGASLTVHWGSDMQVLVATRRYWRLLWVGSIQTVAYFCVVMVAWAFDGLSVSLVLYAFTAGGVAAFILGRIWVPSSGGRIREFRSIMHEGLELWGGQAAQVASARIDQFLVLPVIGAAATGIYSVAVTIGSLPVVIGLGLGSALFQGFVKDFDPQRVARGVRASVIIAGGISLAIAVAAIPIVPLLFGDGFHLAVPVSWIVLAGSVFVVASTICSMAFVAQRRGRAMTLIQVAGLAIAIALLYPAGQAWGSIGAAVASSVGYLLSFVVSAVCLRLPIASLLPRLGDFRTALALFFGRKEQ